LFYYYGGGPYPWSITADGDTVSANLFSDDALSADGGWTLLYFTAPKEYGNTTVFLDGKAV
jgi:hypothetical protein